ncbi:MAG: hypothetical protein JWN74_2304 [Acidobacteriaceae bacterium]|nr:hypothetical protein [Acidobacteriaceae bacterium]
MTDHIQESIALLDRVVSEMEKLKDEQYQAKSNVGWRGADFLIYDTKVLRDKMLNFKQ